jgi:hypothetical protein
MSVTKISVGWIVGNHAERDTAGLSLESGTEDEDPKIVRSPLQNVRLYQHAFADHWRTVVMDLSRTSAPVQDHIVFDDQG